MLVSRSELVGGCFKHFLSTPPGSFGACLKAAPLSILFCVFITEVLKFLCTKIYLCGLFWFYFCPNKNSLTPGACSMLLDLFDVAHAVASDCPIKYLSTRWFFLITCEHKFAFAENRVFCQTLNYWNQGFFTIIFLHWHQPDNDSNPNFALKGSQKVKQNQMSYFQSRISLNTIILYFFFLPI